MRDLGFKLLVALMMFAFAALFALFAYVQWRIVRWLIPPPWGFVSWLICIVFFGSAIISEAFWAVVYAGVSVNILFNRTNK